MKKSWGYVYGNSRDPARQIIFGVRLVLRWPPALYLVFNPKSGVYAILGPLAIGILWGRWTTQP